MIRQFRLLLWCKRFASGFAQVEFVNETARRQVVQRLRTELQTAEIHFEEITLPIETPRQSIANHLVERLRHLSPGVVSVDGFAASLSMELPALANSIYRLNFMREPLGGTDHRQIWWLPTYLAELLERMTSDLESWIQLN